VTPSFTIPSGAFSERPHVLLADDHAAVLALTADLLADECLVIARVGDGRELLTEAERLQARHYRTRHHYATGRRH
jgi:hypothetical protein